MAITLDGTTGITASGNITGNYILGNGSQLSGVDATSIQSGTSNFSVISSGGNIRANIGGVEILRITSDGIENAQSNGVGNIGTSSSYFNTVFAQATSAQYADVAERYVADQFYAPGTVIEIGGSQEVTQTTTVASDRIIGAVSTNPALIMNSSENSSTAVTVALIGRVPCCVVGKISKGSLLCSSSTPGHAQALAADSYRPGVVIGKALEDHNSDGTGVIEVLIGRL